MADVTAYTGLLRALTPPLDDYGHAPGCGYTDETQQCGCAEMGERLWQWLRAHDADVRRAALEAAEADVLRVEREGVGLNEQAKAGVHIAAAAIRARLMGLDARIAREVGGRDE